MSLFEGNHVEMMDLGSFGIDFFIISDPKTESVTFWDQDEITGPGT